MSNKNNTPEQKGDWEANKHLGSRFRFAIPAHKVALCKAMKPADRLQFQEACHIPLFGRKPKPVAFWAWNKRNSGVKLSPVRRSRFCGSAVYEQMDPGTPGRKATRHLNNLAVFEAESRAQDPKHNFKFMSASQRMGAVLRASVAA